jgi:RNA polymerase sigma factor (sigma-70 family)
MIQDATYDPRVQELECRVQRVRGRLITHGVPLAKRAAKQYRTHLEPEQIEQEAMVGLIRAVDTYDSSKGASFSTWLHRHVRWAVMVATRREHHVHLSQKANTKYLTYRRTLEALTQRLGATPTDEELASEMGEAVTEVRRIAAYVPDVAPLDEEDEDSGLTIEQSTPATANHYAITVPGAEDPFDFSYVAEAVLDALTEREALLLDASEGITGPKGTRRSLAAFLELPEQKIKADLERVRYRLRKNTWLLEFKRTMGYVTQAEHDAAVRARDARLPKHPAGAPIVPRPRPPRRPPAPVAKFYLGTRELGELEGRCHAPLPMPTPRASGAWHKVPHGGRPHSKHVRDARGEQGGRVPPPLSLLLYL